MRLVVVLLLAPVAKRFRIHSSIEPAFYYFRDPKGEFKVQAAQLNLVEISRTSSMVREVKLPTGNLTVTVEDSEMTLDELVGFAARMNPRRGFLFVSKVLGKHWPVSPSLMLTVHEMLAGKIPESLPGPIVMIGMAETATCLGQGVFEAFKRRTGREDLVFIHSTRYRVDKPVALRFVEEHSHAVDHTIYLPDSSHAREFFENAVSIVLVDDEASTGQTFVNLARAFKERIPSLSRVLTAMITDWRGPERGAQSAADMPVPSDTIALLYGKYKFRSSENFAGMTIPNVVGNNELKDHILLRNFGRHGITDYYEFSPEVLQKIAKIAVVAVQTDRPVLVLGTGEFAFPPFLLALELEKLGAVVFFQATTRSPLMLGGSIECGMEFLDNYDDCIPNFLYNAKPADYGQVVIVHETISGSVCSALVQPLAATLLELK